MSKIIKLFLKKQIENWQLINYPLFVSYERSGTCWINQIMELYFDRPRLRRSRLTQLNKKRKDWMWIHDHDMNLKLIKRIIKLKQKGKYKFDKILYLYRNSDDVLKSAIKFRKEEYDLKVNYEKEFGRIKHHKKFYFSLDFVVPLKYENFLDENRRVLEFKKICDFFGEDLDKQKVTDLFQRFENKNISHGNKNSWRKKTL